MVAVPALRSRSAVYRMPNQPQLRHSLAVPVEQPGLACPSAVRFLRKRVEYRYPVAASRPLGQSRLRPSPLCHSERVKLRDALETLSIDGRASQVYGQPYETVDGATIIPVAKVRGRLRPSNADEPDQEVAIRARPVGVFVIKDGIPRWEPAVDATPIALIGVLTGFVAAAFATLAMVRRPPWPDLRFSDWRPKRNWRS